MASKLLRVNSKYRTPNSASNTDFTVNIQTRDLENISRCVLLSATIPRQFGNVYAPHNIIYGSAHDSPQVAPQPFSIVIPPGLYTSSTLAEALNTILNAEFSFITVTYDDTKKRIKIMAATSMPPLFQMYIKHDDGLAQTCGFTSYMNVGGLQKEVYAESATALQGVSQIYVESVFIGNRACLDVLTNGLSIPLVNVIGCGSTPEGFDINYQASNQDCWEIAYNYENTGLANLCSVDCKICDTYGNVLPLPKNQNVDLVFKIYK